MSSSTTGPSPSSLSATTSSVASSSSAPIISTITSILPGLSSGFTKLALGYPLDTLKVLLQTRQAHPPPQSPSSSFFSTSASSFTSPKYSSRSPLLSVAIETLESKGIKGFYRGCSLASTWALTDAVLLSVLWEARRALWADGDGRFTEIDPGKAREGGEERRLSLVGHGIAGCLAGLSVVPIAHPIDHVKSKIQHSLLSPSSPSTRSGVSVLSPSSAPISSSRMFSLASQSSISSFSPHLPTSSPFHPPYSHHHHPPLATPSLYRSYVSPILHAPRALLSTTAQPLSVSTMTPWPTFLHLLSSGTLYKGVAWTSLIRFGQGGLFLTYEVCLRGLHRFENPFSGGVDRSREEGDWIPRSVQTLVAGSVASLAFWAMFLPADTIKSRIITSSPPTSPPPSTSARAKSLTPSTLQIIRKIYLGSTSSSSFQSSRPSLRNFYKGGAAVALRAGMVNGLALMVWEGVLRGLGEESFS